MFSSPFFPSPSFKWQAAWKKKDYALINIRSIIGNKIIVRQGKGAYQGNPYVASLAVARWLSGTHYLCPSSPCKMLYGLPMSALVPFQRKEWTRWKRKALRKILSMSAVIQRVNKTTYTALSVKCLFLKQERLSPLVTRKSDCSTTT